jgi:hypothetical protein
MLDGGSVDDLVLVLIVADVSDGLRAELAQCGATLTRSAEGYHRAQVASHSLVGDVATADTARQHAAEFMPDEEAPISMSERGHGSPSR